MTLSRMIMLTMVVLVFPFPGITAELELHKFEEHIPPHASEINKNFSSLKNAIIQTRADLDEIQSDIRKREESTKQILQRLEALESSVEQLKNLINSRSGNVSSKALPPTKEAKNSSSSTIAEYVSEIIKVQVVSVQAASGIKCKLKFVNMTDELIELFAEEHRDNTYLIDENSNQYPYEKSELSDLGRRLDLSPGGQRILEFDFSKPEGKAVGRQIELYCKIGYTEGKHGNVKYLFVTIKKIII